MPCRLWQGAPLYGRRCLQLEMKYSTSDDGYGEIYVNAHWLLEMVDFCQQLAVQQFWWDSWLIAWLIRKWNYLKEQYKI